MVLSLEEARRIFAGDRFATERAGITIEEIGEHRAVCRMELTEAHVNANHAVMGGAIFTLADFAAAVAANSTGVLSVTTSANVQFLASTRGRVLTAAAEPIRTGRTLSVYSVRITDDLGVLIAYALTDCVSKG